MVEEKIEPRLLIRAFVGGLLMGLANLVPGISGGTMLVAAGVYQRFIDAIAGITRLKLERSALIVLGAVGGTAALAILLLAGAVKGLVVEHRWIMYSLFIGLTLGGVPVVWGMINERSRGLWIGAAVGFIGMAILAIFQSQSLGAGGSNDGFIMMLVAGAVAAGAMILPGISGGYLFLVLGVYVPILGAIDQVKVALKATDISALMDPTLSVVLPVGVGVLVGVVVVSNLLSALLKRHETPTLGVLLGLLVGAVVGLWPFQQGVAPKIGEIFKGQAVTAEGLAKLAPEKFPTAFFTPTVGQIFGALALIVLGFALTAMIARLGREPEPS